MKYRITNTHAHVRSYKSDNGQSIEFAPGETKTLKTKPPRRQSSWVVEAVEQTATPDDIKTKENSDSNSGGE